MKRITKTCPKCGNFDTNYGGRPVLYGCPFVKCKVCGTASFDKDYREIEADGVRKVDIARLSIVTLFWALPFLLFGGLRIVKTFMKISGEDLTNYILVLVLSLAAICFGAWLIVKDIRSYEKRREIYEKEKFASESRLNNLDYAISLTKLGYNVPEKYLEGCEPNVLQDLKTNSNVAENRFKRKWQIMVGNFAPYASCLLPITYTVLNLFF